MCDLLGNVSISGDVEFTVDSDLNGPSPQFIFTCVSTGGPATTVTWTRDSVPVSEGTKTVLDDPVTAQYTHTLTVTEIQEGLYRCTVANNKPSEDSAEFVVLGKQHTVVDVLRELSLPYISCSFHAASNPVERFMLTASSNTSVTFSWRAPTVAAALTSGYSLTCTPLLEGIPPPETLALQANVTVATVTGLHPGVTYKCSITTSGLAGPSQPVTMNHTTSEIGIHTLNLLFQHNSTNLSLSQPLQVPRSCLKLLLVRDKSTSPGLLHK